MCIVNCIRCKNYIYVYINRACSISIIVTASKTLHFQIMWRFYIRGRSTCVNWKFRNVFQNIAIIYLFFNCRLRIVLISKLLLLCILNFLIKITLTWDIVSLYSSRAHCILITLIRSFLFISTLPIMYLLICKHFLLLFKIARSTHH